MLKPVRLFCCAVATCSALHGGTLLAQAFPTKPIRVINPASPGGNSDIFFRLREPEMEANTAQVLRGLSVTTIRSIRQQVASLSGGQRQSVAIGRAVMWNSKIVILDEPTAALGVAQTRQVLDLVRRLAEQGLSVVLVSHNLHDIFEVADRITVLRLGRNVAIFERSATTQQEVVHAITAGIPTKVPGIADTDPEAAE